MCNGAGRLLTVADLDNCEPLNDYMKEMAPSVNSRVTDFLSGRTSMPERHSQGDHARCQRRRNTFTYRFAVLGRQ